MIVLPAGIIGVLGGFTGGVLVVYEFSKWAHHTSPPSSQPPPAPLYEDIEISTVKCDQVNENVAYGVISQST